MSVTAPKAAQDIVVAIAVQAVAGTPADIGTAVRLPCLAASFDPGLQQIDPRGLPPIAVLPDRLRHTYRAPRATLTVVGDLDLLSLLLRAVTGSAALTWSNTWADRFTLWRDDGVRLERIVDAVGVKMVLVSRDADGLEVAVEFAGQDYSVLATGLVRAASSATPLAPPAHPGMTFRTDTGGGNAFQDVGEIEVEFNVGHVQVGALNDRPLAIVRQLTEVHVRFQAPLTTESATRPAAAVADTFQVHRVTWARGTQSLDIQFPRAKARGAQYAELRDGELADVAGDEDARGDEATSGTPAVITLAL